MNRPRLSHHRHPMFAPHHADHGWLFMLSGLLAGVVIAIALAYAMAAQP